ncbi:MAG: hypothetical protein PHP64_07200 [Actinomycetota bacterium]|nr:hypothetical protein [Actinomycetota bacterium]
MARIEASGMHYQEINEKVRSLIEQGYLRIVLEGVNGQRYIGDGLTSNVDIVVNGVPGNDLGAFMNGPNIFVNDNAQDAVGNTMNAGKIVIRGHAGDVIGYGMRGGKIFVSGDVGYRVGIHMKSYADQIPVIVSGGRAGDFFGEYMAGGILVLLGIGYENKEVVGTYVGTGMHGGTMYIRGDLKDWQLGREVRVFSIDDEDKGVLLALMEEFSDDTTVDVGNLEISDFLKLKPFSHRPYGDLYVY